MPHFVREKRRAAMWFFWQRKHEHRPLHPGPIRRGVGNVYGGGKFAGKDFAFEAEEMFRVRPVREDIAGRGIHQQKRSAERFSPKRAGVLIAECSGLVEGAGGFVDLPAALFFGRDAMGEKSDPEEQAEEGLASHPIFKTARAAGFVFWDVR
jgi:hypothetical protein